MKSFILIAILLSVVIAQTTFARIITESSLSESEYESDSESEEQSPALTCVLFKNLGCNTECSIIATAFSVKGTGECSEQNQCRCSLDHETSFESLWKAKFNAPNVFSKIQKNQDLSSKVLEILRVPFKTAQQTKRQLQKILRSALYKQLVIDDQTPAAAMIDANDKLNNDKIKRHVFKQLGPILKSSTRQLKGIDIKTALNNGLKNNADDDLQHIIHEVRRTRNKTLSDIVDEYLSTVKTKEHPMDLEDTIADAIGFLIVDRFVNQVENPATPIRRTSSSRRVKKSASKEPLIKMDSTNTPEKEPSNKATSKTPENPNTSSQNRFQLPGFDKSFLKNSNGIVNKTFKNDKYTVHYQRSLAGDVDIGWQKGTDDVSIQLNSTGAIIQEWHFGDVVIYLSRGSRGLSYQTWKFGDTEYNVEKSPNGKFTRKWTDEKKDLNNLKKYQGLISEWCSENEFLVPKNKCIIYPF